MFGLLGNQQQAPQQQGLLGQDWRQAFQGFSPYQQPIAPNMQQIMPQGSPIPAYGLSPEYIGLLSQTFPNFAAELFRPRTQSEIMDELNRRIGAQGGGLSMERILRSGYNASR